MKARTNLAFGAMLAALVFAGPMARPGSAQEAVGAPAAVTAATARREANYLRVNGTPTLLTWARGVQTPEDLDQYRALGLNTAYLELRDVSEERLSRVSSLAAAAEERGLLVVIALAARTLRDEAGNDLSTDPLSDDYRRAVEAFVGAAVHGVGERPRLIAWAVQAVPPADVVIDDAGFISYLRIWYSSLNALNESWGTTYAVWDEITLGAARDVDSGLPYGIGRASVDYASYQESAYADALSLWAKAVRTADPGRLLFAASLPDYRSIASVPALFDAMVIETYPTAAEADWETHNVHAVDIARRANRFAAVQTLQVGSDTSQAQVASWAGLALAHGAAGLAFSSWTAVKASEELRAALPWIAQMALEQAYPDTPLAQTAIVYEPIAGGVMMRGRALYGYLDGVTPGSPTNLFAAARAGSRFGLLDVLGWEDLAEMDLSQYGTIIAPTVFYLPDEAQLALHNYVLRGGALVVDAGIGMYQAEGTTDSMPPIIREILGLRYLDLANFSEEGVAPGDVIYGETFDPAVPTEIQPLAPNQEGQEIDPALTRFVQGLELFLTQADVAQYLGERFVSEGDTGLRVKGLGKGFAVYSPDFLYDTWDASDPYFNEFHDRVLSYGSDLEITEPDGVWPGVTATFYDGWSVGVASPYGVPTSVLARGAGNQMYWVPSGAVRFYSAATGDRVELLFPGEAVARAVAVPIFVWPLEEEGVVAVSIVRYERDGIELVLNGTGNEARVWGGEVEMIGGEATPVEIEVKSGAYPVSPDSVHRVVVQQGPRDRLSREWEVMPDPDTGSLVIEDTIGLSRIIIEPVEDEI
ncbi:MAG TPA: beta-galactosidase trimerization domain-containing protein [Armatimonadota bacterium]|nr:beta-galactosidase trimerization domain-containing protein [Armatimonadota bacterium]